MSRVARCLNKSFRNLSQLTPASRLPSRALHQGVRSYGQPALRQKDNTSDEDAMQEVETGGTTTLAREPPPQAFLSEYLGQDVSSDPEDPVFAEHLNHILHPLTFPPALARRIMTHSSHALARRGHNGGLTFVGRRVLNAYTLLFLQASPNLTPDTDLEDLVGRSVFTSFIGQHLGAEWGIGRRMVWAPSLPAERADLEALRRAGLYKVQGEVIQAIVGAVYHQYGASVAHRLFHTRILPRILYKGGLPLAFHDEVHSIAERMGGPEAPLIMEKESSR